MKKVLFITSYTPAKYSAGQNFTMNLLADLGRENAVDVVYFKYHGQNYVPDSKNITVVKALSLSVLKRVLNFFLCPLFHPIFSVRFSIPTLFYLRSLVKRNSYDMIFFDFSQVFLFSLFFRNERKILIAHDVIYQKFLREGSWLEQFWIFRIEKMLFRQKNIQVYTFSEKDKRLIGDLFGYNASRVINFYLSPKIIGQRVGLSGDNYFCLFAAWNRPENHEGLMWFIKEVLPHVGTCRFKILGANMPPNLTEIIKNTANTEYLGFVENPYVVIAKAKALIAPLFKGAGVKVKVIESLACGTPVLGTSVALEGVPEIMSGSLIGCNSSEDFIREIVNFDFPVEEKAQLKESFLKFYNDKDRTIVL